MLPWFIRQLLQQSLMKQLKKLKRQQKKKQKNKKGITSDSFHVHECGRDPDIPAVLFCQFMTIYILL